MTPSGEKNKSNVVKWSVNRLKTLNNSPKYVLSSFTRPQAVPDQFLSSTEHKSRHFALFEAE